MMISPMDTGTGTPLPPQQVIKNLFVPKGKSAQEGVSAQALTHNRQKTWFYFGLSAVLLLVYGIFFFYPNLNRYISAGGEIQTLEHKVADYKDTVLPTLEKQRSETKDKYEAELSKGENIVDQIFPGTVNKTGITERLESFASLINDKTPPFEMDTISFEKPIVGKDYAILPMGISFFTSRTNLDRFLKLIDLSGRFDSEYHVRLMEIRQLDIRYMGVDPRTGLDKGVNVTVKLNAYSRS
ncbi:hypothetical protein HZA43_04725 [Candidatus Peregrinibacteria bacterium]|nr:hypothetical protein [Candidatus Peregrinibacteria bacterium]